MITKVFVQVDYDLFMFGRNSFTHWDRGYWVWRVLTVMVAVTLLNLNLYQKQGSISDGENLPCTCSKPLKGRRHQVATLASPARYRLVPQGLPVHRVWDFWKLSDVINFMSGSVRTLWYRPAIQEIRARSAHWLINPPFTWALPSWLEA